MIQTYIINACMYVCMYILSTNTPIVVLLLPVAVDTNTLTEKYPGILYECATILAVLISCELSPYKK